MITRTVPLDADAINEALDISVESGLQEIALWPRDVMPDVALGETIDL